MGTICVLPHTLPHPPSPTRALLPHPVAKLSGLGLDTGMLRVDGGPLNQGQQVALNSLRAGVRATGEVVAAGADPVDVV